MIISKSCIHLVVTILEVFWTACLEVTTGQNDSLLAKFTAKEVKLPLVAMHHDKAPGLDGMNPAFFQKNWDTVGADIVQTCLNILDTGILLDSFHDTTTV